MFRKILTLAAAIVAASIVLGVTGADASGSRPNYATPADLQTYVNNDDSALAQFLPVKYADFYTVSISTSKSMTHPVKVTNPVPGDFTIDLDNLTPNTTYYATVQVTSSRGEALSKVSKVSKFYTFPNHI